MKPDERDSLERKLKELAETLADILKGRKQCYGISITANSYGYKSYDISVVPDGGFTKFITYAISDSSGVWEIKREVEPDAFEEKHEAPED